MNNHKDHKNVYCLLKSLNFNELMNYAFVKKQKYKSNRCYAATIVEAQLKNQLRKEKNV